MASQLTAKLVGPVEDARDEENGYWFWGLMAVFVAIPELLAAFSSEVKADIPWPTVSNLIGKSLEREHHWVAAVIVGVITAVIVHVFTRPSTLKCAGRAVRSPGDVKRLAWGWQYIVLTAVATAAAGFVVSGMGGDKNAVGYAIYGTLALFGVVIPSALAYFWHRVLAIPTLFATLALLETRHRWVATVAISLLVVLMFHLALYPWPNLQTGV
jgi:hypothetical protein